MPAVDLSTKNRDGIANVKGHTFREYTLLETF